MAERLDLEMVAFKQNQEFCDNLKILFKAMEKVGSSVWNEDGRKEDLPRLLEMTPGLDEKEKTNLSLNLSLRGQVSLYEAKKAEIDSLMESSMGVIKTLQQEFFKGLTDEPPQLESEMRASAMSRKKLDHMLHNFVKKLAISEHTVNQMVPKTPSSTGVEVETEEEEEQKRRIENRMIGVQKELVEMESKANSIVAVHGSYLGVSSLLYNALALMINCTWHIWFCVGLMLAFVFLMLGQIYLSYHKIQNIGRKRLFLVRQLRKLREDANILARTNSSTRSVMEFASKSDLEWSISLFSGIFLIQLMLPAICLIIVSGVTMYSGCQGCGKTPTIGEM